MSKSLTELAGCRALVSEHSPSVLAKVFQSRPWLMPAAKILEAMLSKWMMHFAKSNHHLESLHQNVLSYMLPLQASPQVKVKPNWAEWACRFMLHACLLMSAAHSRICTTGCQCSAADCLLPTAHLTADCTCVPGDWRSAICQKLNFMHHWIAEQKLALSCRCLL